MEKTGIEYRVQYNIEAAQYTSADAILKRLDSLKAVWENKSYTVAFLGQFSAGKSLLINNILGRDILPVHTTETTPIITRIRYGKTDIARINYIDGAPKDIPIDDVKQIWQSGEVAAEYGLQNIATVDVFVNNAFLQSGMIIADTPGINTIISRHEVIAERLLSSVEEIFFVTAKTLTAEDLKFLDLIIHFGIKISVVRTHMDAVNFYEENPLMVEEEETTKNINFIGKGVRTYFVSNLRGSKYFANIAGIREYIAVDLSNNLYGCMESSCNQRLGKLQESLVMAVQDKLKDLEAKENGEKQSLKDKQSKLVQAQDKVRMLLEQQTEYVEKNKVHIKQTASGRLEQQAKRIISGLKEKFSPIEYSESCNEEYENKANNILYDSIADLREAYFHDFNNLLAETNKKLESDVSLNEMLNQEGIPKIGNIDDLILKKQREDAQLGNLEEELEQKKLSIERMGHNAKASDDYERQIEELQAEIDDIKSQREALGTYHPQYVTIPSDNTWSNTLSEVGNLLDWATILIPSLTPSKAKIVAKSGQLAVKAKIGDTFQKTVKAVQKANSLKNAGKAILKGAKRAKKLGLFDIISLEHWGGKIGECFDEPERQVVDEAYRQQFFDEQRKLEVSAQEKVASLIALRSKAGRYESDEAARRDKLHLLQQEMPKIAEKMEKRRLMLETEARREFIKKLSNEWVKWTEGKIFSLAKRIEIDSAPLISRAMDDYAEIKLKAYSVKLDELATQKKLVLEKLSTMTDNELHQEIVKGKNILKHLEGVDG